MSMRSKKIIIATLFIWIGFVCAISFMEAWIKFRAEGITLPLGLSVGRLVFYALNKVEIVLSIVTLTALFFNQNQFTKPQKLFIYITITLLLLQTFWLLPQLDARAALHIQGADVPNSYLHFYYVAMEVVKVVCLSICGIKLLKT